MPTPVTFYKEGHSAEDIAALRMQLAAIGPGWSCHETRDSDLVRAERAGTVKFEQAALTPEGLLAAVEQRESTLGNTTNTPTT